MSNFKKRSLYIFISILGLVVNLAFFLCFFEQLQAWMVRLVLTASLVCILVCRWIAKWFPKTRLKPLIAAAATYAIMILISLLQFKLAEFTDPNTEKWRLMGTLFVPFYIVPTVLVSSFCITRFFELEKDA